MAQVVEDSYEAYIGLLCEIGCIAICQDTCKAHCVLQSYTLIGFSPFASVFVCQNLQKAQAHYTRMSPSSDSN